MLVRILTENVCVCVCALDTLRTKQRQKSNKTNCSFNGSIKRNECRICKYARSRASNRSGLMRCKTCCGHPKCTEVNLQEHSTNKIEMCVCWCTAIHLTKPYINTQALCGFCADTLNSIRFRGFSHCQFVSFTVNGILIHFWSVFSHLMNSR